MNGELVQIGDRWQLRFRRQLAHPVDKVWRAITEPEHLQKWFPDRVVGHMTPGASLRFEMGDGESFDGEVLTCDPPKALELRWGTDLLRFEIEADADGCVLTLLDTIIEVGKAARDTAGWHVCLDKLEHALAGTSPTWTDGERWTEVNSGYVKAFPAEASTIDPPEGWQA